MLSRRDVQVDYVSAGEARKTSVRIITMIVFFFLPPPLIPERSVISATLSRAPLSALYPHLKCKTLYGTIVSNFFGSHLTHPTQLAAHNTIDYDWRGLWSHVYYYRHKNGNGWRWKPVECRAGRPCYFEGEQHFSHKWKESGCYDYYFHMKYIFDVEDYMGLRAEEILLVQGGKTTPPHRVPFCFGRRWLHQWWCGWFIRYKEMGGVRPASRERERERESYGGAFFHVGIIPTRTNSG